MTQEVSAQLFLQQLHEGFPGLTKECGATFAQSAAVILDDQGHKDGKELTVEGDYSGVFGLHWPEVTDQMRCCFNDMERATEDGAYGIAFLLILYFTDYSILQKSRKGNGFDYWLGFDDDGLLGFQARLEVSGVRRDQGSDVRKRVSQKISQVKRSEGTFPAIIIVIEFSKPLAQTVRR